MIPHLIAAGALAAAAFLPAAASATVVVTDESRAQVHIMDELEQGVRARFGGAAVDQARNAYSFIWVGRSHGPALPAPKSRPGPARAATQPMLLMKDVGGWYGWHTGRKAKLPRAAAQELDRILAADEVWVERRSLTGGVCPGGARLLYARHAGRDLVRRECGGAGLGVRLAGIASAGRASGTPFPEVRPAGTRPSAFGVDRGAFRNIFDRSEMMAAAWERGNLAGWLEPYAEDAVIVRPDRTLRGREALIASARREREWRMGAAPAIRLQSTSLSPPVGGTILQTREYRLEKDGREMKRVVTSHWQRREGLWQIVREEIGADVPL